MPVLSPSGQEHARSIEHDLGNATRDDFASERGKRLDDWENRRNLLLAKHAVKETHEALKASSPLTEQVVIKSFNPSVQDYDEWERWAEYRKQQELPDR